MNFGVGATTGDIFIQDGCRVSVCTTEEALYTNPPHTHRAIMTNEARAQGACQLFVARARGYYPPVGLTASPTVVGQPPPSAGPHNALTTSTPLRGASLHSAPLCARAHAKALDGPQLRRSLGPPQPPCPSIPPHSSYKTMHAITTNAASAGVQGMRRATVECI